LFITSQDNDDCSIGSLSLGHISSVQKPVAAIQTIHSALEPAKRGLNFVTLSLPAKPDWSTTSLGAALGDVKQATNSAAYAVALTGLDFSTATLSTLSDADVGSLWQEVMLPLSQRGLLSTVTIATNTFTYPAASLLYELLKKHNRQAGGKQRIDVVATELLRSHKSRPGLLSGGYPYAIPHRMSAPSSSAQSANGGVVIDVGHAPAEVMHLTGRSPVGTQVVQRVQEAAEDFRMAMDRCMHAEKTFLAKVPACDHCRVC
jgi:hypothetical protein